MNLLVPDYITSIKPYTPGKPLEELEREYGIRNSIKLASNENPLGPSPKALEAIRNAMGTLHRYPDGSGYYLVRKLSEKLHVQPENIVLGNGSDDVIGMLARAFLQPGDEAIMTLPSFLMYDIMVQSVGARSVTVPLKALHIDLDAIKAAISPRTRMIFLTNPNNPTGAVMHRQNFQNFIENIPSDIIVVLDEAYIEFAGDPECVNSLDFLDPDRLLVALRTFSKAYGLAGLRIGYGIMPQNIAELLHRIRQPFNANSLAQVAAAAALDDEDFLRKSVDLVRDGLAWLYESLDALNVKCFPTEANFFLIDVGQKANDVFERLLRQGVIVRSMSSYGYPEYIRVTVGLPEENLRFINALKAVL